MKKRKPTIQKLKYDTHILTLKTHTLQRRINKI